MADKKVWETHFVHRDGTFDWTDRMARLSLGSSRHEPEPIEESLEEGEAEESPLLVRGDYTDDAVRNALARLFVKGAQSFQARRHRLELIKVSFQVDPSMAALEAICRFSGTSGHIDEDLKQPGSPLLTTTRTSSGGRETVTMGFFPMRRFESPEDARDLMTYCGITPHLQFQAQLNLAVPEFIHHFRGHSTVLEHNGWVYANFLEYKGPETQISRDFSNHTGGRRGLSKPDQFLIGGLM